MNLTWEAKNSYLSDEGCYQVQYLLSWQMYSYREATPAHNSPLGMEHWLSPTPRGQAASTATNSRLLLCSAFLSHCLVFDVNVPTAHPKGLK